MVYREYDPISGQTIIVTPKSYTVIPKTTTPSTTSSTTSSSSVSTAPKTTATSLPLYNPLESAIAKQNPEFAQDLYETRTRTKTTTPSVVTQGETQPGGTYGLTAQKPIEELIGPQLTPLEQVIAKTNPEMAMNIYNQRTGIGGPSVSVAPTDYKKTWGYTPPDTGYSSEVSNVTSQLEQQRQEEFQQIQWLSNYKQYISTINSNISTIQNAPEGTTFSIGDKTGLTREQAIAYYNTELNTINTTARTIRTNLPLLETNIKDLSKTKNTFEAYQGAGYVFNKSNEGYYFTKPKASEVVKYVYGGDRPDIYTASELRTLGMGVLFSGAQQLITGSPSLAENFEATSENILGTTRRPGESELAFTGRFWTSPEAIADVWVPLATMGIAKGVTMVGRAVAPRVIAYGSRVAEGVGATGSKIISGAKTVAVGAGKVLSTPAGMYGMKYGMYGAMGAPALIDVATNNPTMLGSTIGKSLFRWETTWGAMDIGISGIPKTRTMAEPDLYVGQPVSEDIFMRDIQKEIHTSGPQVYIGEEQNLAEFGIKPRYTLMEQGQQGMAEVKLTKFTGTNPETQTTFTGYILTSDKTAVVQTGETAEQWWGTVESDLHPSLTPGELIVVGDKQSLLFGTATTEVTTKAGLLTKEERILISDFKGVTKEPMETSYHFRQPRLEEPGIKTDWYTSSMRVKPRSGEAINVAGTGESRSGYQSLYSTMDKNKLIITEGTRAETEFTGGISPRLGPQFDKQFVKEYGDVFSKTKAGETNFETGISGGDISVIKPQQLLRMEQIEGVELKVQKGLSGGTSAFKMLAQKETTETIAKAGEKGITRGATAGGMLLSKTAEEELDTYTYARNPYAKTQGITTETEYISAKWNETKPSQKTGSITSTIPGVDVISLTGKGEVNIDERDQFTGYLSGVGLKPDLGFKEDTKPDFGMRTYQEAGTDLTQASRQEQQSLTRLDQTTDLVSENLTMEDTTPIDTPGGIHVHTPWFPRRKKDEDEETKYYKPVRRQRDLIKKTTRGRKKGLPADLLSVTQSQARYGESTQPRLTKKVWSESEKTLFKRTPTEELMKGGKTKADNLIGNKKNKGGKKNVYY